MLRGVEQLAHLRFVLVGLLQAGRFSDRVLELDVQRGGDHLGDPVDVGVGDVHRTANVFDRCLGRHGAEGDDLRHIFPAVFLGHVIDHFAAPVHAEIHVDVRQRNALGIQEALEEQLVLQGIDIGDPQRIGNQRARSRTAARAHRNAMLARVADEVPHNQEVSGKLHLLDDGDFLRQTLLVISDAVLRWSFTPGRAQCLQPPSESITGHVFEIAVQRITVRYVKVRERIADFFQPHVAAFRDRQGAREHVGRIFKDALHFFMTLDEKPAALELHAIGVLDGLAGLDAQHHVLGVSVVLAEIVAVVGSDHRQAQVFFQAEKIGMDAMLLLQTLVLDLEIEVVRTENIAVVAAAFRAAS